MARPLQRRSAGREVVDAIAESPFPCRAGIQPADGTERIIPDPDNDSCSRRRTRHFFEDEHEETTRTIFIEVPAILHIREQVGCAQRDAALIMLTLVRSSEELMLNRRTFIASVSLSPWVAQAAQDKPAIGARPATRRASRPLVISSDNGIRAVERAMLVLKSGGNTLDAVVEGVTLVEDDPEDQGVGLGGLPNAEGEVELDASVMYGPTGAAGAVGALKSIRNPAKVARLVMQRTTRVFLVGEGALQFALAHGFQRENLLTEKSRLAWLKWKEELSGSDDWVAPPSPEGRREEATGHDQLPGHRQRGGSVRRDNDQRAGVQAARPCRRFSHHRCRPLRGQRRGCGGCYRKR